MNHAVPSILLASIAVCMAACSNAGYYMQAARGQTSLMSKREPIAELLEDPATDQELRRRLVFVEQVRDFASSDLALPDNGSYRSYADLGRPHAVWNIFATPEFSVEPLTWCFLFVGCVAYRGYFDEDKANDFAAGLRGGGNDVYVGGVPAYSTLGKFDDPVLNTMIFWDDEHLAGVIFHELAHQLLYVKDDAMFNESFASAVEEAGVQRWLQATGREAQLKDYLDSRHRLAVFGNLIMQTRERLRTIYAAGYSEAEMRRLKQAAFEDLRNEYFAIRRTWGDVLAYDGWFDRELNNAHLVSVSTYRRLVPAFRLLLSRAEGNLQAFYEEAKSLGALPREQRDRRLDELLREAEKSPAEPEPREDRG